MSRKMIIVPRGTHPDGPYRKATDGDRILIPRVGFTPFTVAGQKAVGAGGVGYCSNGDAGARTGCCHDGSIWRKFAMGAEISPIPPAKLFTATNSNTFHAITSEGVVTQDFKRLLPPGGGPALPGFYGIWMSADHQTIWLGGNENHADITNANTFWRSLDGGDTWTNQTVTHPYGESGAVYSIFGFDVNNLWAGGDVWNAFHGGVMKWNTGTSLWDMVYDYGGSTNGCCLWGRSSDEMYFVRWNASSTRLLRETGGGWTSEAAGAGGLNEVLTAVSGQAINIIGDDTHLYVWTRNGNPSVTFEIYRGTFNGADWVKETRSWSATAIFNPIRGNNLGCDETGAIWVAMSDSDRMEVHRRDPDTGTWALHGGPFSDVDANDCGNLVVLDSSNIFVFGGLSIDVWDGTDWTEYLTADITDWDDAYISRPSVGYFE